jgi:transposase InsO family protein
MLQREQETVNERDTRHKKKIFQVATIVRGYDSGHNLAIGEWQRQAQQPDSTDPLGKELSNFCDEEFYFALGKDFFIKEGGVLYYVEEWIPKDNIKLILMRRHDENGHLGTLRTMSGLRDFWWPTMVKDVKEYVETCIECQAMNTNPWQTNRPQKAQNCLVLFEEFSVDTIGPVKESTSGEKHLMIVMELATRFVRGFALKDIKAATMGEKLIGIFTVFGYPRILRTDGAKSFLGKEIGIWAKENGMEVSESAAYHKEGNSPNERVHRVIGDSIAKMVGFMKENWTLAVDTVLHAYNTTVQNSLKRTPYFLMFGTECREVYEVGLHDSCTTRKEWNKMRSEVLATVPLLRQAVQEGRLRRSPRSKRKLIEYTPGQRVLLKTHLRTKWDPRWTREFEIVEKPTGRYNSYRVRNLRTGVILLANGDHLKLFKERKASDEQEEYEVEKILGHSTIVDNGVTHRVYKVIFKGYTEPFDIWDDDWSPNSRIRDEYDSSIVARTVSLVKQDRSKWKLNPEIFKKIESLFGTIDIDLFANKESRQTLRYCSSEEDESCEGNAWDLSWNIDVLMYANPPYDMIDRVVTKFKAEGRELILVVPWYGWFGWFHKVWELLASIPICIYRSEKVFFHEEEGYKRPRGKTPWQYTMIYHLSTVTEKRKCFQRIRNRLEDELMVDGYDLRVFNGGATFRAVRMTAE